MVEGAVVLGNKEVASMWERHSPRCDSFNLLLKSQWVSNLIILLSDYVDMASDVLFFFLRQ